MFSVSQSAASFYKNELELKEGDSIRLFVQYGGSATSGYALGIQQEKPQSSDIQQKVNGITFFSKLDDSWYTNQITLDYDHGLNDLKLLIQ